jgi:hypothetical protein
MLIVLQLSAAGQGVIIPSGIYMNLSQATMVLQGNWVNNGNYSDQNGTIIINGNTDISGSSLNSFGNITIIPGAMLSIQPQNSVTVSGALTNNADASGLVLKSDTTGTASLIHNTNNVAATDQRYISGAEEAWHFLSSPVSDQNIGGSWLPSGTYGNGTGYDLYLWNEPNSCWIYKLNTTSTINWNTVHPGSDFAIGRGYLYSVQATNPTKAFVGNLNNGSISYGLASSGGDVNLKGFNLVGNPYPSSIDWQAASGWTRSNLVGTGGGYDMWIWNPKANNYGVFNSATGIGTNSVTRYIAPMQGYFVLASSAGNLGMNNNIRVHNSAGNWFKSTGITPGLLSLVVQSETDNSFDEVSLLFGYTANQAGATKLFSRVAIAPSLFMPSGSEYCSVRYFTSTIDNTTVPVMFKPGRDGNYIFKCNFDDNEFAIVILEDRLTNYIQNMQAGNTYSFQSSTFDDVSRFVLHFGYGNEAAYNELPARIYTDGIQLIIDLTLIGKESEAFVYDATGRLLLQKTLQGLTLYKFNINAKSQILIVYLKNQQGNLYRKLFIN